MNRLPSFFHRNDQALFARLRPLLLVILLAFGAVWPAAADTGALFVQVAAFESQANANNVLAALQAKGVRNVAVVEATGEAKAMHKVRVGPFASMAQAQNALLDLAKDYPSSYIFADSAARVEAPAGHVPAPAVVVIEPEDPRARPAPAAQQTQPQRQPPPATVLTPQVAAAPPVSQARPAHPAPQPAKTPPGPKPSKRITGFLISDVIVVYCGEEEYFAWQTKPPEKLKRFSDYLRDAKERNYLVAITSKVEMKNDVAYRILTRISSQELGVVEPPDGKEDVAIEVAPAPEARTAQPEYRVAPSGTDSGQPPVTYLDNANLYETPAAPRPQPAPQQPAPQSSSPGSSAAQGPPDLVQAVESYYTTLVKFDARNAPAVVCNRSLPDLSARMRSGRQSLIASLVGFDQTKHSGEGVIDATIVKFENLRVTALERTDQMARVRATGTVFGQLLDGSLSPTSKFNMSEETRFIREDGRWKACPAGP